MIIYAKAVTHGGGGSNRLRNRPTSFEQMTRADLVIALYEDGRVRILKDRITGNPTTLSGRASREETINKSSLIIAQSVFGENDLKMFREGLAKEIEKAIHETILRFHMKER